MRSSIRRSSALVAIACVIFSATPVEAAKKDTKKAVELSREAIAKYREHQYREAGELFMRSYELSARPAQLRNAAKAYEEGDVLDRALELWRRYREVESLSKEERAEADVHIALINEKVRNREISTKAHEAAQAAELARQEASAARRAAEDAKKTTVVEAEVPPPDDGTPLGGWLLVGAGAIMVVASIALWFVAQDQLSSLDDRLMMRNADGLITGTTPEQTASDVDRINGQRIASGVLLPVGLSAALGGTLWLVFD